MSDRMIPALAGLFFVASPAAQDSVQLRDGRFVVDQKMTRDDKGVTIEYKNGKVFLPNAMIQSTTALDASGNAQEPSAEDKEKLAKGLVQFRGRWVKADFRDKELDRIRTDRKAKIEEARKRRKWVKRHIVKTRNFQFEFTIDPERMQNYMDLMETYFKVFTKEWNIRKPSGMKLLPVCFYHDEDAFHQTSGAPPGVLGYFRFVEPIDLNFFYDRLDEELTLDVMFHEANHYLTHLIDPKFHYPSWINESLAEYYGASEWDPKTKKMKVGALQEGRLAVIQDILGLNRVSQRTVDADSEAAKWQGLEEMIKLKHGEFNAVHYAWGWSFVHYLLSNKKYESKFKRYFVDLARNKNIKKTLARGLYSTKTVEPEEQIKWLLKYLKVDDIKTLEKEWHDYVRSLKPVSATGYHRAGQFALQRGMPIKAKRLLNIAIEMGCNNPVLWADLGRAHYSKREYSEALAAYDKAIAIDPLNGMFYVRKARCLDGGNALKSSDEARRLRQLALEVEPDNDSVLLSVLMDQDADEEPGK